ncbi:nucleotidyltransferase domain-containing protein [Fictibacillus norfolkensis]|uniref:Nucleotidyltransferase domain-containing protein n=1 Tax=Fictibacillus norfolkensis TaxID=2762233 RepID=A0ABR8SR81_9BACL|nr:nucleotidyltransferase domain-containing protein [Fictibacillus norfolkensis]MBD7965863.1 nucleotidyltransferase domain-containing protein [Fictibacillus norfolkensis]
MNTHTELKEIEAYLLKKYDCHTIILYGSYSRGDHTKESDVDLICFSDSVTEDRNEVEFIDGKQLDAWIYPTEKMKQSEPFLRVHKGEIWINKKGLAEDFLTGIQNTFEQGPKQLTDDEKDFQKSWLKKMQVRSAKNDIEGNYRFHWMLKDSLEIYFELKGEWFLGPKVSFRWLKENDPMALNLFERALAAGSTDKSTKKLIDYLCEL